MIQMQCTGRLGRDAETRDANGKKVINFSIAVDQGYGENKRTLWIECAKWGENTGVAQYLTKGTQVVVAGEPSLRTWESNGKNGTSLTLTVNQITLVGGKQEQQGAAVNQKSVPEPEETLPF